VDKIFMKVQERCETTDRVNLIIFLKGDTQHLDDLMGFLTNQEIQCWNLPKSAQRSMDEFPYFDAAITLNINPDRWTFSELRSYIQAYFKTWADDAILLDSPLDDTMIGDTARIFDDRFYVELSRKIDALEDRYYQESMSISIFLSGILKIIRRNLQLEWAAVRLKDYMTGDMFSYLNYDPPSLPAKMVRNATGNGDGDSVLTRSMNFNGEHIANFYLTPGPLSPGIPVAARFLDYIFMMIDDFIYGDLNYKRVTFRLNSEIARLKSQQSRPSMILPERRAKTKEKMKLLLLGASTLNSGLILSEFQRVGFDRHRVELKLEYEKFHAFNTNDLRLPTTGYDGLLIGPIPHKMRGDFPRGEDLIAHMNSHQEKYPSFSVIRNRTGHLKITKTALRSALKDLDNRLDKVEAYC